MVAQAASVEPTTTDKIRGLPWSIGASAMNTVFVQFIYFGPVFVLFLSQLNISNAQIGFLLSMFPFMGLVALFIAPQVARFGYKRTFITFWSIRKIITAFLLLVPIVIAQFGLEAAVLFITLIVIGFGLCRAIAEVGYYPWSQEYVPESIRGKYSATANAVTSLVGIIAVAAASFVLDLSDGLDRFTLLFGVGVVFGVIAAYMYTRVPGGASATETGAHVATRRDMLAAARDSNLLRFLAGIALLTFGTAPLYSFLPIFMQDQVGLSDSNIVLMQNAAQIGGLISVYLLGWSADRYGSKPVLLVGVALRVLLPVGWLLMPRGSELSLPIALFIAFFQGVSGIAWAVGSGRMLFVSVVPSEKKSEYMAVYYAAIGIIGGVSQLSGGALLDAFSGVSGDFGGLVVLDQFTPLMLIGIVLPLVSIAIFRGVRAEGEISVTEFAGLFVQGNPIYALETMLRYYRARDERATVVMTERMGQAHSPLTVDEMLEALNDPRFNVRFEAVISIARTAPHPRLTETLAGMVSGTEVALSVVAAWALGRIGDPEALPALREGLNSEYRSVRMHCARALGTLGDKSVSALLHERLQTESDPGLQMAYASALGNLQASEAISTVFDLIPSFENQGARLELALSLARMTGSEHQFVRLLRQARDDSGTAIAQELIHLSHEAPLSSLDPAQMQACIDSFAHEDIAGGKAQLLALLRLLPNGMTTSGKLLHGCADGLERDGYTEYVLVALHVLHG